MTILELVEAFLDFVKEIRREIIQSGRPFDGLRFWQQFKAIFSVIPGQVAITYAPNVPLLSDASYDPTRETGTGMCEMWHFVYQQARIPAAGHCDLITGIHYLSLVKLMQLALNIGQFESFRVPTAAIAVRTEKAGYWPLTDEEIECLDRVSPVSISAFSHPDWNRVVGNPAMIEALNRIMQ
jgi:hypothetical protein